MTQARWSLKAQVVFSLDEVTTGGGLYSGLSVGLGLTEVTELMAPEGPRTGQALGTTPGQVRRGVSRLHLERPLDSAMWGEHGHGQH